MTIKDYINIEKIKKVVKHKTAVARGDKQSISKEPSEKAIYIAEQLNRYTSSSLLRGILGNIFCKLLGERIDIKPTNACISDVIAGTMIVPLNTTGGHNYPVGKPVLMDKTGVNSGIKLDGHTGNSLKHTINGEYNRYATDAEIDKWFDEVNLTFAITYLVNFLKKLGC